VSPWEGARPETHALLRQLSPKSPLTAAALAAAAGDLEPALALLHRRGRETACLEGGLLTWKQEKGLPAGGLDAGCDPITALAVMGFALYGLEWPEKAEMLEAWREARHLWRRAATLARRKKVDSPQLLLPPDTHGR